MTGPALPSCVFIAAASISPSIAAAQAVASPDQVIVVTAPRSLPPPQRELRRQDIDSYGASSIGELLGEVLDEEGVGLAVLDEQDPVTASVLVKLRAGKTLSNDNVTSIVNLVAGGVPGMDVKNVSVVDDKGNYFFADVTGPGTRLGSTIPVRPGLA